MMNSTEEGDTNMSNDARDAKRAAMRQAFSSAGARMQGIRASAHERLQGARESVTRGDYKTVGESLGMFVKDKIDSAQMQAAGFGDIGSKLAERRKVAQEALLNLSGPLRAKVMLAIRENVKGAALADKDMPVCLKRKLAGGIDLLWDDIMVYVENSIEDVREVVRGKRITDIDELGQLGAETAPTCCSPRWMRAFLLYKFLPYDLSIFGQMKDFWFWVFMTLSMIPTYGIRITFFLFLLIAELTGCPADEYQLVQFILMFKGCQFVSSGVCMAIYVAVKYFLCVHKDEHHTCETNGPAAAHNEISALVDIFGSCILVWFVFWMLPRSTRSAGERDIAKRENSQGSDAEAEALEGQGCCRCDYVEHRGGRMRGLLRYDLGRRVCFILSGLFFVLLTLIQILHLKPGELRDSHLDQHRQSSSRLIASPHLGWHRLRARQCVITCAPKSGLKHGRFLGCVLARISMQIQP
ncbi:unnamed protein product [Prorocentrum cordatum]|uniref:Uncharacterized protein n=1 Tax=Prorocentrum cordatum TaxID=2364126 RepID=A0ABN9XZC4_9DINO|nr:unnamed protein product [Polarella glacialis]